MSKLKARAPWRKIVAAALALFVLLSCAGTQSAAAGPVLAPSLASAASASHPLAGRIYATGRLGSIDAPASGADIGSESFLERAAEAPIVLLGEIHDNAGHHLRRAQMISAALAGRPIVFEQLRADQQATLDAFVELKSGSPDKATVAELKRLLDWDKSGWMKDGYDPLLQAAIDSKLPITAGDVSRASIMDAAKRGEAALPAGERARLKLDVPLGAKLDDASLAEIEEAHCGAMPKEAFGGMAYAQRYRDASLADAVLKITEKHGSAILIAGNNHVRTDRGVAWYLRQRAPDKKVISVMLVEVEDGKNDPAGYVPRDPGGKPATDYIIFTPGADHGDPCEKMREKMKK